MVNLHYTSSSGSYSPDPAVGCDARANMRPPCRQLTQAPKFWYSWSWCLGDGWLSIYAWVCPTIRSHWISFRDFTLSFGATIFQAYESSYYNDMDTTWKVYFFVGQNKVPTTIRSWDSVRYQQIYLSTKSLLVKHVRWVNLFNFTEILLITSNNLAMFDSRFSEFPHIHRV